MHYFKPLFSVVKRTMGSYELIRDEEKGIGIADSNELELVKRQSTNGKNHSGDCNIKNANGKKRLVSLDVFRGLTVALMILVDDAGGLFPSINHSPWNGITLADVVMPFFLFIVGVSLALVYKKVSNKLAATQKAVLKFLKLLLMGIILQGGYFHGINDLSYGVNLEEIRVLGVLQRISVGYLLAALCEIWLSTDRVIVGSFSLLKKYYLQWVVAILLTTVYIGLLYGLYVPDWQYEVPIKQPASSPLNLGSKVFSVKCGVRGDVGPACNAVGMVDRHLLGLRHLYKRPIYRRTKACSINSPDYGPLPPNAPSWCEAPFDPEGILSTLMAVVTCFIGLHFGHVIIHFKGHRERIIQWMMPSLGLIIFGFFLDATGMHLNKALYSVSYMCVTSGISGLLLTAIYFFVDVYEYRRLTILLEWMGKNALVIYVLAACNLFPIAIQGFYWKYPENNILSLVGIKS
eukprot:TRINITY_DN385_c0_g1_i1.p1 TRINITY_DN385_c0_g1~~TRINITY_DN385_c0_g1_i1.p1  ORF type:complete len:461 (-),score=58.64 TRINITY_DN385_c0_g1_i1:643-2025(-)